MRSNQTKLFKPKDIEEKILIFSIRIILSDPLLSEVLKIKREFIKIYGKKLLSESKPHITIAQFIMSSSYKNLLTESMDFLKNTRRFMMRTNGLSTFENGNTLCIKMKESEEFQTLLKTIQNLKRVKFRSKMKRFKPSYVPHITIASFLDKETLESSHKHFRNEPIIEVFEVDSIVVTSRENGKTWDWKFKVDFN